VIARSASAAEVRELIVAAWPYRFNPADLRDDASLGEDGLGLDSVEVVEVLLACEEVFGRPVTEELFTNAPLTIALVADHFRVPKSSPARSEGRLS
jgi:acyl carrier protein